ncbi:MAG: LCP family protein [Anaerofustis sp.]
MSNNSAEKLKDLKNSSFGLRGIIDQDNTEYAVSEINDQLNATIQTTTYNDFNSMTEALYNGDVEAIVLNENYRTLIDENDSDFESNTKVIAQIKRTVSLDEGNESDISLTENTFNILVSGIDTYGDIETSGRSDVNMLITVDPVNKKILLTSIPRDFYVPLYGNDDMYDKLTHSGLYGIDCTMSTVGTLLDTKIDYYIRVNFSSVIDIVDALGGISVDSPYSFSIDKYTFKVGKQTLSGEAALMFSRDRKNLPNGDRDRIKNQQLVMMGIIDKLMSTSIITNYTSFLNAISGTFETNLSSGQITSLIQMQLTDMSEWTIAQQYLNGSDAHKTTYTYNDESLYVMVPYENTVEDASAAVALLLNGTAETTQSQTTDSK